MKIICTVKHYQQIDIGNPFDVEYIETEISEEDIKNLAMAKVSEKYNSGHTDFDSITIDNIVLD